MAKLIFQRVESTFGSLLRELQQIWEETGETEVEMDKALSELEQECLQVYRRRVEQASHDRARLHQTLAEKEAELASLFAVLGERPQLINKNDKRPTSLRGQIAAITPQLEELRLKKEQRIQQFTEVKNQIQKIRGEIYGGSEATSDSDSTDNWDDLSVRRLDEHHAQLQNLQKEKSERLHKVLDHVNVLHELCSILAMDFANTVNDVHPSLNDSSTGLQMKSISNETLERLSTTVHSISNEKNHRTQMLQSLVVSLNELWSLLDTPLREKRKFHHLTCRPADFSTSGGLSLETIEEVKAEVQRLEQLKATKMKELVLKKRSILEQICSLAHIDPDPSTAPEKTNALIDSGMVDAAQLLANLEEQIVQAQEESQSRKEILDRVDKWLAACEEERWLEDYSMDEKRFNATKGAHLNLKRAEKARVTVTKLPGLVDALIARTRAWEEEKGVCFLFDGVRLISMLDDYIFNRNEREDEKRRSRDKKKLQDQFLIEQECLFGSKPSPNKSNGNHQAARRLSRPSTPSTPCTPRRSMSMRLGTPDTTPRSNGGRHSNPFSRSTRVNGGPRPTAPLNFVAMQKDDIVSPFSPGGSDSSSPMGSSSYA
ncbi:hypothetical protein KP509_10G054800 [Ceratopteris richardii]|uniref:Uncharacterized protein n=1 Tax=Ceratopteris richardii TaxID=49495 RepID=A0A8T2TZH7_CERRI|nr:hypothetical protein KP509_10G054800 [Ceratopteris richardii]KAH7427680.1 hypothetical protein KP509_10G054800 [Ceratopteris richardii]